MATAMASSAMGAADDSDANSLQLTSTTAPGKVFASRSELAAHYKSPWHKYNLKRRQAGLPVLLQVDFEARLQAAQALRKSSVAVGTGKDHLKDKKKKSKKKKQQQQHAISDDEDNVDEARQAEPLTVEPPASQQGEEVVVEEEEEEMNIDINPRQCLFDRHISSSVSATADRMQRKYGFFIPDREYLVDLEGLLGYCHEKIQLGHVCLYCQRVFSTASACQKHMLSYSKGARHCKLRYEEGVDLEEFDVFYDFSESNAEFLRTMQPDGNDDDEEENAIQEEENDNGDDGWEDVSDDDEDAEDDENDDDDDDYDGYEEQVAGMGLDVTPLGELVFPDGRIIGHRSLKRYYKQRLSARRAAAQQSAQSNVAVQAALEAAGERLYRGRVYNIHHAHDSSNNPAGHEQNALALSRAGLAPGMAAGRAGKGLLVKASGGSVYTQLSVYRYRAAVRKERRGKIAGERLQGKQLGKNMNRMDKRANRLMNNVSVAHAKR